MKGKPNIDQFLEGGAVDKQAPHMVTNAKVHREQKIFRLPVDLIAELKKQSYERSVKTGVRVTETELVEQALRAYFDI